MTAPYIRVSWSEKASISVWASSSRPPNWLPPVSALAAFVAVWLLMNRTRTGKALTATALNPPGRALYGHPHRERMNALAWGIGGASVTVAGALIVNFWSVNPYVGLLFTMIAFTIVALGGFGSVPGAFFAGIVVGLITEIPGFWDFMTYHL